MPKSGKGKGEHYTNRKGIKKTLTDLICFQWTYLPRNKVYNYKLLVELYNVIITICLLILSLYTYIDYIVYLFCYNRTFALDLLCFAWLRDKETNNCVKTFFYFITCV